MGLIHVGAWDGREYVDDKRDLVLIEPQTGPFMKLQENFRNRSNVKLVKAACGSKPGTAEMYVTSPDHSSSILRRLKHKDYFPHVTDTGDRETVQVITLDSLMLGPAFDELVVDVQGYELAVLTGAATTIKNLRRITCEVSTEELYEGGARLEDIDTFLVYRDWKRTETKLEGVHGDAVYTR